MAARKKADWDAIEPHYRAGIRSLKDIAAEHEISDAAIIQHAKRQGWTRNLKAKIQAKADAKVSAAMVSPEVSAAKALTEANRIEVEAEVQARIRLDHRKDIGRARTLCMGLLGELEATSANQDLLERLAELLLDSGDEDKATAAKRWDAFEKAISLSGRVSTLKALTESLRHLVALEREAYGIVTEPQAPGGEGDIIMQF